MLTRQHQANSSTSTRKAAVRNDKNTFLLKERSKYAGRRDAGKARKYFEQEQFVCSLVQDRWNSGDPITKHEIKDEVCIRDDCAEGTAFYSSYLDPTRSRNTAPAWINWLNRVLGRVGYSLRKNSVGQTVPVDWYEQAIADAKAIRERMAAENCNVVVNADQTFVNFYPETKTVVAPVAVKRVGGNIKSDEKAGFTLMVSLEMGVSEMIAPFIVYNGTKITEAQNPKQTLWYKYQNWRDISKGRTSKIFFQKKHWFDDDITIEYLKFFTLCILERKWVSLLTWRLLTKVESSQLISKKKQRRAGWSFVISMED